MNTPHPAHTRPLETQYPSELNGVCFISDLHLSVDMPRTLAQFEHFCQTIAPQYSALIILGDLFEFWIGDDVAHQNPAAQRFIKAVSALTQRGLFVGFMVGNRDFLVRDAYCRLARMTPLPDPCTLKINGQAVLLTHGDLLCTDEKGYQRFRRIVHLNWVQNVFLKLPQSWRNGLAQNIRNKSKRREYSVQHGNMPAQNIPAKTAAAWFDKFAVRYIIHGHTHQPSTHLTYDSTRIVLPDWECENPAHTRWGYISWPKGESTPQLIVKNMTE